MRSEFDAVFPRVRRSIWIEHASRARVVDLDVVGPSPWGENRRSRRLEPVDGDFPRSEAKADGKGP